MHIAAKNESIGLLSYTFRSVQRNYMIPFQHQTTRHVKTLSSILGGYSTDAYEALCFHLYCVLCVLSRCRTRSLQITSKSIFTIQASTLPRRPNNIWQAKGLAQAYSKKKAELENVLQLLNFNFFVQTVLGNRKCLLQRLMKSFNMF